MTHFSLSSARFTKVGTVLSLAGVMTLGLSQCEKKPTAEGDTTATPNAATDAAVKRKASILDHADKLGFASKLTNDTELYYSTVGLKSHLDALQKTVWWKDASALINDKTPAPASEEGALEELKKIWGDDVFIAGGSGTAASMAALVELNQLTTEMNFKSMMARTSVPLESGDEDESSAPSPLPQLDYLQSFLQDPELLTRVEGLLSRLTSPPLIMGVKTADPAGSLAKIITPEFIKDLQDKKIVIGDLKTPDGFDFKTVTLDAGVYITQEWRDEFLTNLDDTEPTKPVMKKILDTAASKKLLIAWGAVHGHIIIATGENLDHLKFSQDAPSSLLGKPELASLLPHVEKNLLSIAYLNAATAKAATDPTPFTPMLKGMAGAMKDNATFSQAGTALETQVNELAAIESKIFTPVMSDTVLAAWWDKGLRAEIVGGAQADFLLPGKPLNYAALLENKDILFGITYHKNPEFSQLTRTWVEKLVGVLYNGTKEMLKAGVGGPSAQQQFAFFEALALPTVQKVYASEKEISQKGLGNETALIIDLGGKAPALPDSPPLGLSGFIRASTVNEVADRAIIASNWKTIQETVGGIAALIGMSSGSGNFGANPFPTTETPGPNGFTSWTITNDTLQGDLAPNATISDKHLILGFSRTAAEEIATTISSNSATPALDGCLWKVDVSKIIGFTEENAANLPNQTPEQLAELKQNLQWVKPFKLLEGRIYQQDGTWHRTFEWDIEDIVSFD